MTSDNTHSQPDRPRVVFVDIDDTLVRHVGHKLIAIPRTVSWVRAQAADGAQLFAWSQGGAAYAKQCVQEVGLEACFVAFLPKPDLCVDDRLPEQWRGSERVQRMT